MLAPRNRYLRSSGAIVHRSLDDVAPDRVEVDGIPCTGVPRTLIDSGAVLPGAAVELLYDRALTTGLVDLEVVTTRFLQLARRGRRGIAASRAVLEARDPSMAPVESVLELRALRILDAHGLPQPVAQVEVVVRGERFRLDLAYPELKVAIELDGRFHDEGDHFDRDRRRQNLLVLDGWLILRFTWRMVHEHPADVAHRVRQALTARRAA